MQLEQLVFDLGEELTIKPHEERAYYKVPEDTERAFEQYQRNPVVRAVVDHHLEDYSTWFGEDSREHDIFIRGFLSKYMDREIAANIEEFLGVEATTEEGKLFVGRNPFEE